MVDSLRLLTSDYHRKSSLKTQEDKMRSAKEGLRAYTYDRWPPNRRWERRCDALQL